MNKRDGGKAEEAVTRKVRSGLAMRDRKEKRGGVGDGDGGCLQRRAVQSLSLS